MSSNFSVYFVLFCLTCKLNFGFQAEADENLIKNDVFNFSITPTNYEIESIENTETFNTATIFVDSSNTTKRANYCPELFPKCSCLSSSLIIQCNNFTKFDELDFSSLIDKNTSKPKRIFELEIAPFDSLFLNDSLNLTGIELYNRVVLRNIKGFNIYSNPFESVRFNNNLSLFIYNSELNFYRHDNLINVQNCTALLEESFISLFVSFDYILFGNDMLYSNLICPVVFKDSNIRLIEFYYLNSSNKPVFIKSGISRQLNSRISQMRVYDAKDFILDDGFLNSHVFEYTETINFDYINLRKIEDYAFRNLSSLRNMIFVIENLEQFIKSSNNTWMKFLNSKIRIDYNQTNLDNVKKFYNDSLLITFNNRNNNQNYSYPDQDFKHFQYFPHENYVFLRILTDTNISCSRTLGYLLKYYSFFKTPSSLNTTSVNRCLLINDQITTNNEIITTVYSTSKPNEIKTSTKSTLFDLISSPTTVSNFLTNFNNSSKDTQFSLGIYLGTVVPLAILSLLSFTAFLVTFFKLKEMKKVIPDNNNEMVKL